MELIGSAAGMFAVTNIDDIVLLALFFGRAAGRRGGAARVVAGQYVGFAAILVVSVVGAMGAGLLPDEVIPYLGLLPLLLGVRAAWHLWRADEDTDEDTAVSTADTGPTVLAVAAVTFANGGDNIGVYVPVFVTEGTGGIVVYAVVFLVLVGAWCAVGRYLATRQAIARVLSRWGHVLLPVVLIGLGVVLLVEGGAFDLPLKPL